MANIIKVPANTDLYLKGVRDISTDSIDIVDMTFNYYYEPVVTFPEPWAYWKCDETTGDRLDSTANHRDVSPTEYGSGAVQYDTGKISNAVKFPEGALALNGGLLRSGTWAGDGVHGYFTFAFWAYVVGDNVGAYPDCLEINSLAGVDFFVNTSNSNVYLSAWTDGQIVDDVPISPSGWHFYVVWADAAGLSVEIDNVLVANDPYPDTGFQDYESDWYDTYFGYPREQGNWCMVDEFGVWDNRALTADQRTYLYNSGAGRTYPFS